jgi:hypothetical protein
MGAVGVVALLAVSCDWSHYRGGSTLTGEAYLSPFDVGTIGSVVELWRSDPAIENDTPTVRGGKVYTGYAVYDASGTTGCSGTPTVCEPLWKLPRGPYDHYSVTTSSDTFQFSAPVSTSDDDFSTFSAFDVAGCPGSPVPCDPAWTARSTGYENVGSELDDGLATLTSPTVADGKVFVGAEANVYALDAAGTTNCSGSPKVCTPLWQMAGAIQNGGPIAVHEGNVFVHGAQAEGYRAGVFAYDANGQEHCLDNETGQRYCFPLWASDYGLTGSYILPSAMTSTPIAGGVIYSMVAVYEGTHRLYAFDEHGNTGCTTEDLDVFPVRRCPPLWTADLPVASSSFKLDMAVADGKVYVPNDTGVQVFDAAGTNGCSGTPKVCTPMASFSFSGSSGVWGGVTVANGVAYLATRHDGLFAFDADLSVGCTGAPAVCTPVAHLLPGTSGVTAPALQGNRLHVTANDQVVTFGLP